MRRLLVLATAVVLCGGPLIGAGQAGAAVTEQIEGSGSTWAQNAINQWISDETAKQLQIVYTGSGSAQGRIDFREDTTDFAVSDIGFQGVDPSTGTNDTNCQNTAPLSDCRAYAYLPIVAGGTSFPYQIRVGGQLVQGLRLSGETLAKIFTDKITNWDDPEIAADNDGHFWVGSGSHAQLITHLPSLQIITVVDSEGSGASAQFTRYLATEYPSIWNPFSNGVGMTEYFPRGPSNQRAEPGSTAIMSEIASSAANGAIGYDEYSYPLNQPCSPVNCPNNWPVALLENSDGYFTAPTQYNVAVALTLAQINMDKSSPDYLLQNLNNVYTNPDKRTYALSSYSYMIIPTSGSDPRMGTNAAPKARTLADFIDYAVCGGQTEMGPLGYSPLPINLAQASFEQMYKLHTADPAVQISQLNIAKDCDNPTFWAGHPDGNHLADIAPEPPACDKAGQAPCLPGEGVGPTGNPVNGKPPASSSPSPTSSTTSGSTSASPGASTGTGSSPSTGTSAPGSINAPGSGSDEALIGTPTSLAESEGSSLGPVIAVLAVLEVLLLLALPPIIARRRQGRPWK
jgi:phosphate transport system substrate-binding protein